MRSLTPLLLAAIQAAAAAQPPDKTGYTLLNPTPVELRRPVTPDRPDFTESPHTVDAGAVQIEMSFVDYAENGDDRTWTIAPTNLKLGLRNDIDIQFVFEPFVAQRHSGTDTDGFGDTQIRLKINIWGNDSGRTAFAVMPFIKIPTATGGLGNNRVEGGVIFPFAIDLADRVGLGLMAEADLVYSGPDRDYDIEFIASAALGIDLTDRLATYLELIAIESTDPSVRHRQILGLGATFALKDTVVLDLGVNFGLMGDTDDINVFSGLTWRF